MKYVLVALLACTMLFESKAQLTVNGVSLPAKLKTATSELDLNGGGVRKKAFFKVYVLGLYLPEKSKDAAAILKNNQEIAVRLQITSSVVSSSNMSEAIREGFTKSLGGNTAPMKAKIDAFISIFSKEEIKEKDVFILDYVPGVGVKSFKNGKLLSTTEGEDFKKALFGIWLGPNPIDSGLKTAILGN
ncbi:MAG TPA: chalcone isomerase family protein [Chitinophagales bacterium]|nr:chalcone isomerase family protein [Chitinophagales bacterium]HMZ34768.1 chalcone isomerase family protein [Chitinophagales bacterium]HNB48200.1 chalcone isomerase family protein [Chitinophagales bacterium]HNC72437.1 chalcone isomerase family protein [Chitinophagales bacterium]HND82989.1 chalcone isomerase family protein [Chitinophagales bacterium]